MRVLRRIFWVANFITLDTRAKMFRDTLNWHILMDTHIHLGLYSLSGKTSYHKISWSLEAARFGFELFQSLWNLAGTSAALLPRCLSNFRAIRLLQHPISRLRDFTRFGGKTSYRLVNRGPESEWDHLLVVLNSSPPSAAYVHQWTGSALVQITAYRLFGTKPLSKPLLWYC